MFTSPSLNLTGGHVPPPVLKIEPGDVIVVSSPHRMNEQFMQTLLGKTKQLFPGHHIVVFGDGIQFSAVRPAAIEHSSSLPDSSTSQDPKPVEHLDAKGQWRIPRCPHCRWALYAGYLGQNPDCSCNHHDMRHASILLSTEEAEALGLNN
jgi:hypothetical protein